MFGRGQFAFKALLVSAIAIVVGLSGCASKSKNITDNNSDLILKYKMPADAALQYMLSNSIMQNIEIEGNAVSIVSDDTRLFSVKSLARENNRYRLDLTIDSIYINVATPRGDINPDVTGITGRGFEFMLSDLGKETEYPDNSLFQYEITSGKKESVIPGFQAFFPDLPNRSITIGDTWTNIDTVKITSDLNELLIITKSKNRLEGFETIDGTKCARIIAEISGEIRGQGQEMGMSLTTSADITGSEVWYFAIDEGVLLKMVYDGFSEGTIVGTGAEEINIPMSGEYAVETQLIR